MTNNQTPKATLSMSQVNTYARDVVAIFNARFSRLTPSALIEIVEEYCDNPDMTRSDINRIRIRAAQMLNH